MKPIMEIFEKSLENIDTKFSRGGVELTGASTGYVDLDILTRGLSS